MSRETLVALLGELMADPGVDQCAYEAADDLLVCLGQEDVPSDPLPGLGGLRGEAGRSPAKEAPRPGRTFIVSGTRDAFVREALQNGLSPHDMKKVRFINSDLSLRGLTFQEGDRVLFTHNAYLLPQHVLRMVRHLREHGFAADLGG